MTNVTDRFESWLKIMVPVLFVSCISLATFWINQSTDIALLEADLKSAKAQIVELKQADKEVLNELKEIKRELNNMKGDITTLSTNQRNINDFQIRIAASLEKFSNIVTKIETRIDIEKEKKQ